MNLESAPFVGQQIRNLKRYREIVGVFSRHGFGEIIHSLNLNRFLDPVFKKRGAARELSALPRPVRFRLALEELGSSFIKFGQILASRPDLLPLEYVEELHKLEDEVPAMDFDDIRRIVETELDRSLEDVFLSFSEKPLAAASIAQIHEGVLPDGEQVVVKVQRPNLRRQMKVDLEIIRNLAVIAENHMEGVEHHRPSELIEQVSIRLMRELDFGIEMAHIDRFRHHLGEEESLFIPEAFDELSSSRVLVMQKVDGIKPSRLADLKAAGHDPRELAHNVSDLMLKQIFRHGFFHADPHAGNLFVLDREGGKTGRIAFIDFGMMGTMSFGLRENFADMLYGIARRDERFVAKSLLALTNPRVPPDQEALESDISEFMTQHFYRPLRKMRVGKLLNDLIHQTTRHGLRIPMELFMLIKAVSTMESLVRALDPEFDLIGETAPHVKRVRLARAHPERVAEAVAETGAGIFTLFRFLPGELHNFLRSLANGQARFRLEHHGLKPLIRTLDQVSNRISFAIVLASLIVGSSLIMHAGIPPQWNGIPVIGLVGYVLAGIMGLWLLYSIIRHGKM